MNKADREKLVLIVARRVIKFRDALEGMTLMMGGESMTVREMCEIARDAITLIEEGRVT